MEEDNKDLTGQTPTGTGSKTTAKKAAAKETVAKTTDKVEEAHAAQGVDTPNAGGISGTEDHPNPARMASDAAEAVAETAKDTAVTQKVPTDKSTTGAKSKDDPFVKLAKEYASLYPGNKVFYITSDKQVFLEKDKNAADNHQRTLKGGQVTTVNID